MKKLIKTAGFQLLIVLIAINLIIGIIVYYTQLTSLHLEKYKINITYNTKIQFEKQLNTYASKNFISPNENTQFIDCKSEIIEATFDENVATKGVYKIYAFVACFGYRVVDGKKVEGSSFDDKLIYFDIPGTNAETFIVTNIILFDFPDSLKNSTDPKIIHGLEILKKYTHKNLYEKISK